METHKPKILILDFDRTLAYLYRDEQLLLDLAELICEHYSAFLTVEPSLYTIDGYKAWHQLHRLAQQQYSPEKALEINAKAEELVTSFEARVVKNTPFFENTVQTLERLHKDGIQLMIVSSNASSVIRDALKRDGVLPYFSQVIGRPLPFDPNKIKPSPYPIEQALEKTKAAKENIWYVGDDLVDIDAAKACGLTSVAVASGKYTAKELKEHGANHAIKGFSDIYSLLE